MDMRQGPSGPGPRPDTNYDKQMDQDDDHMEGEGDKVRWRETCWNTRSVKTTTGKSMAIYC